MFFLQLSFHDEDQFYASCLVFTGIFWMKAGIKEPVLMKNILILLDFPAIL